MKNFPKNGRKKYFEAEGALQPNRENSYCNLTATEKYSLPLWRIPDSWSRFPIPDFRFPIPEHQNYWMSDGRMDDNVQNIRMELSSRQGGCLCWFTYSRLTEHGDVTKQAATNKIIKNECAANEARDSIDGQIYFFKQERIQRPTSSIIPLNNTSQIYQVWLQRGVEN